MYRSSKADDASAEDPPPSPRSKQQQRPKPSSRSSKERPSQPRPSISPITRNAAPTAYPPLERSSEPNSPKDTSSNAKIPSARSRSNTASAESDAVQRMRKPDNHVAGRKISAGSLRDRPRPQSSMSGDSSSTIRQAMSPSLNEAFASPSPVSSDPAVTSSTESGGSSRTITAAEAVATPGSHPPRTPSYPFPQMPSRKSSSRQAPLHEPFTALSPLNPGSQSQRQSRARDRFLAQNERFIKMYPEKEVAEPEEDSFKTPDLADVVLQLSSELSLEAWWTRLSSIMRDSYRMNRMSLAVPVDNTDIENVPWGQKAAYNVQGLQVAWSSATPSIESWASSHSSFHQQAQADRRPSTHSGELSARPSLGTRHSYAGYEAPRGTLGGPNSTAPSNSRPPLSRWVTTDTPALASQFQAPPKQTSFAPYPSSISAADDSDIMESSSKSSSDPRSICHRTLYALNREQDPLIDSAGINRILERGSAAILTREFKGEGQATRKFESSSVFNSSTKEEATKGRGSSIVQYEDYEQQPANPWSRSPAPSPAIQEDPDENPFFASTSVTEDSFDDTPEQEPDYNRAYGAIGVDNSCTLIHLPLLHPQLSKALPKLDPDVLTPLNGTTSGDRRDSDVERKAPIAILSIMSDAVPYPRTWTDSLANLGPHFATSFHTCFQNSMIHDRLQQALERQSAFNQGFALPHRGGEPFALGLGLDSLLQYDYDDTTNSTAGSLATPSEPYSANTSNRSAPSSPAGTPAQASASPDPVTGYFDIRKRQSLERTRSSGLVAHGQVSTQKTLRSISGDHRTALRKLDEGEGSNKDDRQSRSQPRSRGDQAAGKRSDLNTKKAVQARDKSPEHDPSALLSSRGADFKASFPTFPAAAARGSHKSTSHHSPYSPGSGADGSPVGISDNLIRILIDSLPVQVFTADPVTGRITWVNSKFLHYAGRPASDVYMSTAWDFVHPEEVKNTKAAWSKAISTGQQLQHKARVMRFDGHYRYQYMRALPLRTSDQHIVHWVGAITDFHDQHVAETNAAKQQETAASEAKYRALANSSPQIVFAVNRTRGLTFCNTQWEGYSGQSEEQARGLGFVDAVHPEDLVKCNLPSFDESNEKASNVPISMPDLPRSRSSAASSDFSSEASFGSGDTILATTGMGSPRKLAMPQRKLSELATKGILKASRDAAGKQSYSTEIRLRMASGEFRWHLVRLLLAEPLAQENTSEEVWYGTCTDINDHKELEQTLKETMDAKSRFLSNMSHEIRTPLNGIMGMTNFLIDSHLTAEQADHVNVIRASTEGLRDLINDILDLSKVEAGMIKLNMDWMHLRSVVEDVNDLTSSLALDKGIELNYLVEDNVPSMLKGDRFRFRQVLLNVIGNAIKFTQEGEVFVHCDRLPDLPENRQDNSTMIKVEVKDTGPGFSDREADMLFKRFSQIDGSSTRQHGGTGLGLVISMQLVELHGGIMTAQSQIGTGSTFTFTLRFGTSTEGDQAPVTPLPVDDDERIKLSLRHRIKPAAEESRKATSQGVEYHIVDRDLMESPAALPRPDRLSPSSAGSEFSMRSIGTGPSSRSSQSSIGSIDARTMSLDLPRDGSRKSHVKSPLQPEGPVTVKPPIYSILVVCPLKMTRKAVEGHLNSILDAGIPHKTTPFEDPEEALQLISGNDPLRFTHIVLLMRDTAAMMKLMIQTLRSQSPSTSVVVISDSEQRKAINELIGQQEQHHQDQLQKRTQYISKPVKPSRLAVIFDPTQEREHSTDVNKSSAQQVAAQQKHLFEDMTQRLGDKDFRVLVVEDNKINQMVMLKYLKRINVAADTVMDGVQAVDKVFNSPVGHYSIILMDLMMPNKDGFESCADIRVWERENDYPQMPIVALSANVVDDVWKKCKESGFNSYITKPLQFQELSDVMTAILDPAEPGKPLEFMRSRPGNGDGRKKVHGRAG